MTRPLTSLAVALTAVAATALTACGDDASRASDTPDASDTTDTSSTADTADTTDEDLRRELLDMAARDQAVRGGPVPPGVDPADVSDIDAVDAANQARLEEILDEHGWPGWDLVGRKASTAAWVVAQHADLDLALQRRALTLLETAVAAEDASPGDLAYLTDRVLVAEGEPQEYGTQWELDPRDGWRPRTPIADRSSVDERRADAGLDPLRVYLKELEAAG